MKEKATKKKAAINEKDAQQIIETNNNLVAKDNNLIQNSKDSYTLLEEKALLYAISKIKPTDQKGQIYTFSCNEFRKLLRWDESASYTKIKMLLQSIRNKSFWIINDVDGVKKESLVGWFNIVDINLGTGEIDISFHERIIPYLLELQKRVGEGYYYTTYKLNNVILMKHKYSIKLYELLRSYSLNNRKWVFECGTGTEYDIQVKLADTIEADGFKAETVVPKSWATWSVFKRDVLNVAVEEINKYTDLRVRYEGVKEDIHGKKYSTVKKIEFYFVEKTKSEKEKTNDLINEEYGILDVAHYYKNEVIEKRKAEEEAAALDINELIDVNFSEAEEVHEAVEEICKHQILLAMINGKYGMKFSNEKINQLYSISYETGKDRLPGDIESYEFIISDYIEYYLKKIKATPEKTKSDEYSRLYNLVMNDYDNEFSKVMAEYWELH